MTLLGQLRRPRLIRSVFAVFVMAWLQTAVIPCVMAATDALRDTQTVVQPTAEAIDMTASMADMPDCVYCPPAPESDSGASAQHCLYPHESRVDSGNTQQARLDQLVAHPVFISVYAFSFVLKPVAALRSPRYLLPPVSERSLNLTHCKQLK